MFFFPFFADTARQVSVCAISLEASKSSGPLRRDGRTVKSAAWQIRGTSPLPVAQGARRCFRSSVMVCCAVMWLCVSLIGSPVTRRACCKTQSWACCSAASWSHGEVKPGTNAGTHRPHWHFSNVVEGLAARRKDNFVYMQTVHLLYVTLGPVKQSRACITRCAAGARRHQPDAS